MCSETVFFQKRLQTAMPYYSKVGLMSLAILSHHEPYIIYENSLRFLNEIF